MREIVNAILYEMKKYNVKKVTRVTIEVGELTFLGEEQLKFAFDILKENTILNEAELEIKKVKAVVKCRCGYEGGVNYGMKDLFHLSFPILRCPSCNGEVEVVRGRECKIVSVEVEYDEVETEENRRCHSK